MVPGGKLTIIKRAVVTERRAREADSRSSLMFGIGISSALGPVILQANKMASKDR